MNEPLFKGFTILVVIAGIVVAIANVAIVFMGIAALRSYLSCGH